MQTTDQVIDDILLKSPYGAKAYEARHKRQMESEVIEVVIEEVEVDHPRQTFIDFEDNNNG